MSRSAEPPASTHSAPTDAPLELRVLSGAHRDAHCPVHDGATVGSDLACDIILEDADAPEYRIFLSIDAGYWSVSPSDDSNDQPQRLAFNHPLALGGAAITIAPATSPWPVAPTPAIVSEPTFDHEPKPTAERAAASEWPDVITVGHEPTAPTVHAGSATGKRNSHTTTPPRPTMPALRKRDSWPVMLGVAAVILAILVAIIMAYLPAATGTPRPNVDPRMEAAQQSIGQINAALERLGLASRLHVSLSADRSVTVSGWVHDEQEERRVAGVLSQVSPMPALRLSSEAQALRAAQSTLRKFPIKYVPRYEGNGRLRVTGVAPDNATRSAALRALTEQVPGMTILGGDIALQNEVEDTLRRALDAAGLSVASILWQSEGLVVDPSRLDALQQTRLQALVKDLNARYADVIIATQAPTTTQAQPGDSVPFRIRSVVGGLQPYVVLGDGSKLMAGGNYQGYLLVEISDKRLVFEGPHRVIIPR